MYINAGHSRLEFVAIFLLIVVILWQPAVAQSVSLPECTVDIEDNDGDGSLDNDGADGIIDIDKDGDGLIELCDLEGIDRIRYQLDGTGYRVSAGTDRVTSGCPDRGCLGYELVRSLDFADADSYGSGTTNTAWTTGAGWPPIGDTENPFIGVFLANAANNVDITISNLTINRPDEDYVGLFSVTDGSFGGRVLGLRLLEVDIKGRFIVGGVAGLTLGGGLIANSSVEGHVEGGDAWVGGLIGSHYGSIINSYAKGVVKGHTSVGGLVGYSFGPISNSYAMVDVEASAYSGGLVGYNHNRLDLGDVGGRIINSYATGSVRSSFSVGGLVGHNDGGIITDVYASGHVVGSADVGGLVGYNDAGGHISNSYAIGAVVGGLSIGSLIGYNDINAAVINSYWDSDASGVEVSAGGTYKTSVELQSPTSTKSIYVGWSADNWAFGSQRTPKYPTLKYAEGNYNFGEGPNDIYGYATCGADLLLPDCGSALPDQDQLGSQGQLALKALVLLTGVLEPPFDPTKTYYEILDIPEGQTEVTVIATANNDNATITIDEQSVSQAIVQLDAIDVTTETGIHIVLTAIDQSTKHYTLVLPAQPILSGAATAPCSEEDIDKDDDGLIEICDIEGLYAMRYQLDGTGYMASISSSKVTAGCDEDDTMQCRGYELVRDLDFNDPSDYKDSNNQPIWTVAGYDDITDRGWRPIGNSTEPFNAVFKGNGYTLSNLAINRNDTDYVGLFGRTTGNVEITAIGLADVAVQGRFLVGGLVGANNGGTIEHSYVSGNVSGRDMIVGGLVGSHRGLINNSYVTGQVLGNRTVGGLVGTNNSANNNSTSTIINSYALNDVRGRTFVGGLVASNGGVLSNSYASGMVEGIIDVGGLASLNVGNITNSYARGDVSGSDNVGGLVGDNRAFVGNSYASGMVSGYRFVGGLVGSSDSTLIERSYWDVDTSMQTTSAGGTSKTTVELQSPTAPGMSLMEIYYGWSILDWDFAGGRYPVLKYIVGDDDTKPACDDDTSDEDNTDLPPCGTVLSYQTPLAITGDIGGAEADEGDTLVLDVPVSGGSGNYSYQWTQILQTSDHLSSESTLTVINTSSLNVEIPGDFIAPNAESADITFKVVVSDGVTTTSRSQVVTISKIDNGLPDIDFSGTGRELTVTVNVGSDPDGDATVSEYQWQQLPPTPGSQWQTNETIVTESNTVNYEVPADTSTRTRFSVLVTLSDGQNHTTTTRVGDYIYGGGSPIDIYTLEDLNAIRYQPTASYQLRADLDFNEPNSYANISNMDQWAANDDRTNAGWLPLPLFSGVLDGNGHTISNLYINQPTKNNIGLFSIIFSLGNPIKNLGLLNVDIQGNIIVGGLAGLGVADIVASYVTGTVKGIRTIGGLVGSNGEGRIISSFTNVDITGNTDVGGLAGISGVLIRDSYALGSVTGVIRVGGLTGENEGLIINSYATGEVNGKNNTGGLVGINGVSFLGEIINSYASGAVNGESNTGGLVGTNNIASNSISTIIINSYASGAVNGESNTGGLVGTNNIASNSTSTIINSYASGAVYGESNTGGLIGIAMGPAVVTASYWDVDTSMQTTSAGGTSKTTVELQSPIAPGTTSTEVYYGWSIRDWEFGDNQNYPVLRYAAGPDEDACNADVTAPSDSPQCGILLFGQHGRDRGLAAVFFLTDGGNEEVTIEVNAPFSPLVFEYDITIPKPDITAVQLKPFVINDNATITITKQSDDPTPNYFANKANDELSALIALDDQTTLTIVVTDTIDDRTDNTTYTFAITRLMPLQMSEITISSHPPANDDGTIDEGSDIALSFDITGGTGNYEYVYLMDDTPLLRSNTQPFVYKIAEDFLSADVSTQNVTFKVIAHDRALITSRSEVLTIRKIDKGSPDIELDVSPARLSIRSVGTDPDGEGTFTYVWQKRDITDISWITIDGATTATYNLPEGASGSIRYRVDVKYVDGQGYEIDYSKGAQRKSFILMPLRADIDIDDDGLIEIYYLEDLDAIRYQLDGTAYKASADAAAITTGCPDSSGSEVCIGYELARSLDFNNVASYTDSANRDVWYTNEEWQPIGTVAEQNFFNIQNNQINGFASLLEGNGHTLSNLSIDIKAINDILLTIRGIGLFGYITRSASVRNIGLLNVNIQNNNTRDVSDNYRPYGLGGLVGMNDGTVINSYVTGTVNGELSRFQGREFVGGLVGNNFYKIINSYADVWVAGYQNVGGLVGENCHWHPGSCRITERLETAGQIINSYANGTVNYDNNVPGSIYEGNGGLVGANRYIINNSYTRATTNSSQFNLYGGLVGANSAPSRDVIESDPSRNTKPIITASHWEKPNESDIPDIRGDVALTYSGAGRSTSELQAATKPGSTSTEVYYNWSMDDWDFGTSKQYPILRYASGDVSGCAEDAPESEIDPPQCGAFLQNQGIGLRNLDLSPRHRVIWDPIFNSKRTDYTLLVHFSLSELDLNLQSYNSNAIINIGGGDNAVGITSTTISLDALTSLIIEVDDRVIDEETDTFSTTKTTYTIALNKLPKLMILEVSVDAEEPVDEGAEMTLIPTVTTGTGNYRYRVELGEQPLAVLNQDAGSVTIKVPGDLITADVDVGNTTFTIIVEDDFSTASFDKAVMIMKQNNGEATVETEVNGSQIEIFLSEDPDGAVTTAGYIWQKRDISDAEWMAIVGATSSDYNIPQASPGGALYQVLVTYTDAQGYGVDTNDPIILGPFRAADKDDDNDNLIDIYYLEDLDAIRDIYGDMPAICGTDADQLCNGFALRRSLDFNNPSHYETMEINSAWTTVPGWQPIGDIDNPFTSTFIATTSSLTISHLLIDRPTQNNVALFGVIGEMSGTNGRISNIHLRDATVTGRFAVGGLAGLTNRSSLIVNSSVVGTMAATDAWVGVMVGSNYGAIINSYADGNVQGKSIVGGLAGYSFGPISNSYAHSHVISRDYGGGLVGYNHNEKQFEGGGNIINSYATGSVEGVFHVGGLVGYNDDGAINDAYALGNVIGSIHVGGLVGSSGSSGTIVNVYASGRVVGSGSVGDLVGSYDGEVAELATTPTLVYVAGPDSYSNATCGGEQLPACGTTLPGQDRAGSVGVLALQNLTLSSGVLEPPFDPTKTYYEILDLAPGQTDVTVTATANNNNATITIGEQSALPATLQLEDIGETTRTGLSIVLTAMAQSTKHYTIVLPAQPKLSEQASAPCSEDDIDKDDDGLIEICDLEGLYAMRYQLDGSGYTTRTHANKITTGCGNNHCRGYELVQDLDFNNSAHYRNSNNQPIWTVTDYGDSSDRGWRPIGTFANPFNATFEANGYIISNLSSNRNDSDYVGLFGHLSSNAEINAIGLLDMNVRGRFIVGGLVGWNEQGIITNSYLSGSVIAREAWGGGLAGDNVGFITNSYASGAVLANRVVGGLVGINIGRISNSHAENTVAGRVFIGGLAGINVNEIRNSYTTGAVQESIYYAGGLVSLNTGHIENSYAIGNIMGGERVGGLVGDNRNLIAYSYAIGTALGNRLVGGLVGINSGIITDSYTTREHELTGFEFDNVGMTIRSSIVSVTDLQSPRPGWNTDDWNFADGKYPALKYTDEYGECENPPPDTAIPNCNTLLDGQFPMLLALTADAPTRLSKTGDFTYLLRIAIGANMVTLTPTASDDNATIHYIVDNSAETAAMNTTPFTATLPENAQTIIITLESPDQTSSSIQYTVNIERFILTHIRVFLEGLLQ